MEKYNYMCDGGSLMRSNDNFKVHFRNGYGDGTFNVYGYDCDDREVLATITGRYGVYACDGDMLLECWSE